MVLLLAHLQVQQLLTSQKLKSSMDPTLFN